MAKKRNENPAHRCSVLFICRDNGNAVDFCSIDDNAGDCICTRWSSLGAIFAKSQTRQDALSRSNTRDRGAVIVWCSRLFAVFGVYNFNGVKWVDVDKGASNLPLIKMPFVEGRSLFFRWSIKA